MKNLSKENVYQEAQAAFGAIPGIIKELAERSIPTAYLYTKGVQIMEDSSFTALEINAIELKISSLNKCTSCMKGHTYLSKKEGLTDEDIQALLKGEPTSLERLNKLLKASEYIYYAGNDTFPDLALGYFEDEGITEQEILEIIGLISLKTISNYANNYLSSVKKQTRTTHPVEG